MLVIILSHLCSQQCHEPFLPLTVIEVSHLLDLVTIQTRVQAATTNKAFLQLHINLLARFDFSSSLFKYLAQILWSEKCQEPVWKLSGFTEVLRSSTQVLGETLQCRS